MSMSKKVLICLLILASCSGPEKPELPQIDQSSAGAVSKPALFQVLTIGLRLQLRCMAAHFTMKSSLTDILIQ